MGDRDLRSDPPLGCPKCLNGSTIFNWHRSNADAATDSEAEAYVRSLEFIGIQKRREVYRCRKCRKEWGLDERGIFLEMLRPNEQGSWAGWIATRYEPTLEQLDRVLEIGASGENADWAGDEFREVPCRCRLHSGEEIDYCVVRFSDELPKLDNDFKRLLMIDEIKDISASEFALSRKVRKATYEAEEIRMLFSPTLIKNRTGTRFIVNGPAYFLEYEGTKGSEITLADSGHKDARLLLNFDGSMHEYGESYKKNGRPPLDLTLIAADWLEDLR